MAERPRQRARDVFFNFPFDRDYLPLFHAITFAVAALRYRCRCALEKPDSSEIRFKRICSLIAECKFAIHDISRIQLDPACSLPRFNMPLELGVFLGAKEYGPPQYKKKLCLILDAERYRYQKYCSDISGQDIREHASEPHRAIRVVRDWFASHAPKKHVLPSAPKMTRRFDEFRNHLELICDVEGVLVEDLVFSEYLTVLDEWLKLHPL